MEHKGLKIKQKTSVAESREESKIPESTPTSVDESEA
jgi:hypothetical protein